MENELQSPLLILGMHRSGTSCLTGCLQEAGLFLGGVNTKAAFNAKGNRENVAIRRLHDTILARHGFSWDNPPETNLVWNKDELKSFDRVLEIYREVNNWGLKDPRTIFLLSNWQTKCSPRYIGTFRNPVDVAKSLTFRAEKWGQKMSMEKAYDLWLKYNQRLLALYSENAFSILKFDVPVEEYLKKVNIAASNLGLDQLEKLKFRDESLKHFKSESANMPKHLLGTWNHLNDIYLDLG